MAVTSERTVTLSYTGDVNGVNELEATSNASSPGEIETSLASGTNTLSIPTGAIAVTIKPPSGNTTALTIKGAPGDTGIPLHLTDPTSVALSTTATQVVVTTAATISGAKIFWS